MYKEVETVLPFHSLSLLFNVFFTVPHHPLCMCGFSFVFVSVVVSGSLYKEVEPIHSKSLPLSRCHCARLGEVTM